MKKKGAFFLGGLVLVAVGLATGYFFGLAEVRGLKRRWFRVDSPDANLATLHVKARADGTAELRYLPMTQRGLKNEACLRLWDFGFDATEMCLWSDDAATFAQVQACALDPVETADCRKFELRFVRNARTYRLKLWLQSSFIMPRGEKPTVLRIAADGQIRIGDLTQQHTGADAIMSSLQNDRKLGFVGVVIDPACPMGFVFDILASAADRGLTELTLLERHQEEK